MHKHLNNEKGFALVLIMAVLPALIGAGLAVLFTMNYMQMNARHLFICRTESIKTQNKVGKNLSLLLKLNTQVQRLRIEKEAADAAYALAISNMGAGLAVAEAMQYKVKLQRTALDLEQRALIAQSNMHLFQTHLRTQREIKKALQEDLNLLKPFIVTKFKMDFSTPPTLAVSPDITDLAPEYKTDSNFEGKMALVHRWQYRLSVADYLGKFLKGEQNFNRECSVTLSEKDNKWQGKIREDRSLLKSVF